MKKRGTCRVVGMAISESDWDCLVDDDETVYDEFDVNGRDDWSLGGNRRKKTELENGDRMC